MSAQSNLMKFSEEYTDLAKHNDVVITGNVLLDVGTVDVNSIEIRGEGRLVFNQGHDITVKTKGIFVKDNGQLIIGSESCRHEDDVFILLEGSRTVDRTQVGLEGEKFIAVTDNGTLSIFGEDRLAWTKLSATVERYDAESSNVLYEHKVTDDSRPGFAIHILDSDNMNDEYVEYFFPPERPGKINKILLEIMERLEAAEDDQVVSLTVLHRFFYREDADFEDFFAFLEVFTGMENGELLLRQAREDDAFSMVFVVGGAYDQSLDKQTGKWATEAISAVTHSTAKVTSVSRTIAGTRRDTFVDLRVVKTTVGFPEVTVTYDISSWRAGDQVLLASTDYAWDHGEVRTIKEITGEKSFTLTHEVEFRHFGEIEDGVDMRGEVALLSRNVKIAGDMKRGCPAENGNCDGKLRNTDTYGGHIKIIGGFNSVVIDGAELSFMGQTMDEGHYPIHFHMCKNITGKTALVRRNSIQNTFRRAITVHGTFGTSEENPGVQLLENVAYYVLGHTFFLEDGAESATILRGNLGAATMNVNNEFVTDRNKATTFWITNPKTVVIGNVAAGSEGFGIWYTFPEQPLGPSEGLAYAFHEAKHTALWIFDNNVVHSNLLYQARFASNGEFMGLFSSWEV